MSRPARKTLQVWACPHCKGQFKAEHWLKNPLPPHLQQKWSYCPWGFTLDRIEWVCPHCQKYITPLERYKRTKNDQYVRMEESWNAILQYEIRDTQENLKPTVEALPFVALKKVNEMLSGYTFPSSFESDFRKYVWQESCTFSQDELTDINLRKKELFKNPLHYFYYVFISLRSGKEEKPILHKTFEGVHKLILDEMEVRQHLVKREQEDKPNMLRLLDLLGDGFERAEICRQLGMFDECITILQSLEAEGQVEVDLKKEMLTRAKRKDPRAFRIKDDMDEVLEREYMAMNNFSYPESRFRKFFKRILKIN